MDVIITGGTGFIGRGLTRRSMAAGHNVIILTRDPGRYAADTREGVTYAKWDGHTSEGWGRYVSGGAAVVNLAGANIAGGRWTPEYKDKIIRSRLAAGGAVVEAFAAAPSRPAALIQASAVGYYGSRGDDELDESAGPGEGFLADVCRQWEGSTAAVEDMGVRRVVVRSGLVLARKGGAFPRLVKPFRYFAGGPLGGGRQWFSWIHYDDEVAAIHYLLENDRAAGPYNLCAPAPLRNRDLARSVGRKLGRPAWWPTPRFALRMALGEMADELLLASQRARPEKLSAAGFEFGYTDFEAALPDLL
ncbi:MAG: TIGR01777 family oxidoreductase [Candidatus Zixiibacteriota bacterium]|jgi:hypothetical protein